jgi:hypothetical protein
VILRTPSLFLPALSKTHLTTLTPSPFQHGAQGGETEKRQGMWFGGKWEGLKKLGER